jgi:hypothetical protein
MQLVPFGLPLSHTVSLSNEGGTPARFYFVAPPKPRMSVDGQMCWDDNQPISPPWLIITPDQGEVAPGARVCWFLAGPKVATLWVDRVEGESVLLVF